MTPGTFANSFAVNPGVTTDGFRDVIFSSATDMVAAAVTQTAVAHTTNKLFPGFRRCPQRPRA
jgi:hypothetical protein